MFKAGDLVEAVDYCGHWETATVIRVAVTTFLVNFVGWSRKFDRWVDSRARRSTPPYSSAIQQFW